MNFHILTLFPEMVMGALSTSITGRAMEQGKINISAVNIRDFSTERHKKVDDYTYGGGAGMLMQAQPVYDAWRAVCGKGSVRTVYVTPQGRRFDQRMARELAREQELVILCGHYEGVDERVLEEIVTDYVSIGDYVLTGGELAAMVIVDAVARLVPGVLSNDLSAETESFSGSLLEYPQYSRPEVWRGRRVPAVLMSGDQKKIDLWRIGQSVQRTRQRRPDLYERYERLQECRQLLLGQKLLHMDMIELISRGRAELVYFEGKEILLRDVESGIYFHSRLEPGRPEAFFGQTGSVVFHQKESLEEAVHALGLRKTAACRQAVFTRREKLPVRGLYRPDGRPMEGGLTEGLVIRPLEMKHLDAVVGQYDTYVTEEYLRDRICRHAMVGAFFGENLAGFAGFHEEGSIGMLEVYPQYRRRHVAKALETCLINRSLELGQTPYGQIIIDNEESVRLQQSLGLILAKEVLYWTEQDRREVETE